MGDIAGLAIGLALVVSSAGVIAGGFALRAVRRTPLERPIAALTLLFVGLALYHLLLLVYSTRSVDIEFVEAATYTTMTGFVLVMVYFQVHVDDGLVGVWSR
ncbi:hypothetical protein MBEHAL_2143 [Halarchaeum acidiphilum MH1-52-1]|uniref:Uncharacterized protein n=1 Tax=Halarchaeum acidiphilum MH1-52-1 TaxID=1261545 RepID=U3AF38_9EURY|nr:hypothetical protein [Halarchaeum acidiphilum]GAD53383.1 hypothetical protein MBEHAL_2143 [Halarchaeum acidiphilum MH1-52-1]